MANACGVDSSLLDALTKAYIVRATIFHQGVINSGADLLITEIDSIPDKTLEWDLKSLGITQSAFERVAKSGGAPSQIFAHPIVIGGRPYLIAYYRNLAAISKKGLQQILFSTQRYEAKRAKSMPPKVAMQVCCVLNTVISGVVDSINEDVVATSRKTVFAEIGAELQGTWNNFVGKKATKNVKKMIADYVDREGLGQENAQGEFVLNNGWRIVFAAEPDIAFFDKAGVKQIAVEIKGSLDKAGAQSRYGEARKSFGKQLAENPRCHTVYLASCFTDAVIKQIRADQQVRDWFNLTSVLADENERETFLKSLFHIVNAPRRRR